MTLSNPFQPLTTLVVKHCFTAFNWDFSPFKVLLCGKSTVEQFHFEARGPKDHSSPFAVRQGLGKARRQAFCLETHPL